MMAIANELAGLSGSAVTQAATPQAAIPIPVDDRQSSSPINKQMRILTDIMTITQSLWRSGGFAGFTTKNGIV